MLLLVSVLIAIFSAEVVSFNSNDCTNPSDDFADFYYSSVIDQVDPRILETLVMSGADLSLQEFQVDLAVYGPSGLNLHNAEAISFLCSRSLGLAKEVSLQTYIKEAGLATAEFLKRKNVLTCRNAVALAHRFYQDTELELQDMDEFISYQYAANRGLNDFLVELGFNLDVVILELADLYDEAYKNGLGDMCPGASS